MEFPVQLKGPLLVVFVPPPPEKRTCGVSKASKTVCEPFPKGKPTNVQPFQNFINVAHVGMLHACRIVVELKKVIKQKKTRSVQKERQLHKIFGRRDKQ